MQVQIDIEFEELLKVVKALPSSKLQLLKNEIDKNSISNDIESLEQMLLDGPVATKNQLEVIAKNRKAINQWRMK